MNTMKACACQGKQIGEKQMKAKKKKKSVREREREREMPKACLNIWGLRQTLVIVVKLQLQ